MCKAGSGKITWGQKCASYHLFNNFTPYYFLHASRFYSFFRQGINLFLFTMHVETNLEASCQIYSNLFGQWYKVPFLPNRVIQDIQDVVPFPPTTSVQGAFPSCFPLDTPWLNHYSLYGSGQSFALLLSMPNGVSIRTI